MDGLSDNENIFHKAPKTLDEIFTDSIQDSFERKLTDMIDKLDEPMKRPFDDRVRTNMKRTMRDIGRNKIYRLQNRRAEKGDLREYSEMSDYVYDKIKRRKN